MALNVNIAHIQFLTTCSLHGRMAEKFIKKINCEKDIQFPCTFSWSQIESPYDIFLSVKAHWEDGHKKLITIIDYKPLYSLPDADANDYFTVIRDTILFFPEFNFYFDETRWEKGTEIDKFKFLKFFLKYSGASAIVKEAIKGKDIQVDTDMHSFMFQSEANFLETFFYYRGSTLCIKSTANFPRMNPFKKYILGQDNLFDASNLRYLLKLQRYKSQYLENNFESIQISRANKLALCIEEERSQSLFNSIALYLNGFRVRPVSSSYELESVNNSFWLTDCDNGYYSDESPQACKLSLFKRKAKDTCERPLVCKGPSIILRDYDLQFPDAPLNDEEDIKLTRGWNFDRQKEEWSNTYNKSNKYWSNLYNYRFPTFFISKGLQDKNGKQVLFFKLPRKQSIDICSVPCDKRKLVLPGINKPISGIYTPFRQIDEIRKNFDQIIKKEKRTPIKTSRTEDGGHGVPLDLYNLVKKMVDRAELYYNNNRYIHAIIVANEAIEIMNGFHQALAIRAYRCQALAENAAAANILGTDEKILAEDTEFRLGRIESMVLRLSSLGDDKGKKSQNTLNQIYNDIRIFCQDKEHFSAENVVVRKIGHLNEGLF